MNIKQAEALSGVSKRNIRYYEQAGLLHPNRNPENDYREYSPEDIQTLKLIRALRMVDMPLDQVKEVLRGSKDLRTAAADQKTRLAAEAARLETAIRFCTELEQTRELDVDGLLRRMEAPEVQARLCRRWLEDYRSQARAEAEKVFTFIPESAVTTPREFTDALCAYAREQELDLVITKEGMYPEFTIGGVEYTAERLYTTVSRVPVASIRCTAVHPEDFEPDLPKWKRRLLRALHFGWVLIPLVLMSLGRLLHTDWGQLLSSWQGWLVLAAILSLVGTMLYRAYLLHYNENGKRKKP